VERPSLRTKDKKIKKGWMTYQDNKVLICSGETSTMRSNDITYTAFDGQHQHAPRGPMDILFDMDVMVKSLHQLFCVAEGLLRTL